MKNMSADDVNGGQIMEERVRELEQQFGRKLTAREKFYVAMEEAVRDKTMSVPPPPPEYQNDQHRYGH
jgi:hypothetical protein